MIPRIAFFLLVVWSVSPATVLAAQTDGLPSKEVFKGREWLLYIPKNLPDKATRSLLIVLHGGGGNARSVHNKLLFDREADEYGLVVAYLNGSAAARLGGSRFKAWNAGGGCCGKPNRDQVDDVGYITDAVAALQSRFHISHSHTFAVGHSNGGMMLQTMACETEIFKRIVTLSATLMIDSKRCSKAANHNIINYHGARDENVPVAGGIGTKGLLQIPFTSQANAKHLFESLGGRYQLVILPEASHSLKDLNHSALKYKGRNLIELILDEFAIMER